MPRVLNFKRDGLPDGAAYIGRAMPRYRLPASKWRNPFKLKQDGTKAEVIAKFRRFLCDTPEGAELLAQIHELKARDLVCWCAPDVCHGDLLLKLANSSVPSPIAAEGEP
jgi:hypothetical protein